MKLAVFLAVALCTAVTRARAGHDHTGTGTVAVEINGKPFTVFYIAGKDLNRPYLHPLRSATGKSSTGRFRRVSCRETADHPHHAGLFYGHGDVNGYNYWAIQNVPTPPRRPTPRWGASS